MLIGHERNKLVFEKMYKGENVPHAFLLVGAAGVGKKEFALWCGKMLLGKDPRNHPDVFVLNAPNIEEMRNLNKLVGTSSFTGATRVVIIENAHAINIQATNALLKTLEEPKSNTVFFVLCSNKEQVISTIQSRCVDMNFCFVPLKTIQEHLDTAPIADMQVVWEGRPQYAHELLNNSDLFKATQAMVQDIQTFSGKNPGQCFSLIEKYTQDKQEFEEFLSNLIEFHRRNKQWRIVSALMGVLYKTKQSNANIAWLMRNFVLQEYTI